MCTNSMPPNFSSQNIMNIKKVLDFKIFSIIISNDFTMLLLTILKEQSWFHQEDRFVNLFSLSLTDTKIVIL